VRVSLAGRAAEELMFGPSRVANGAMSDLENATRMTYRAFTEWGYAPAMSTPEASRSNLAVVVDTPAPAEIEHNLALTRRFLDEEYTHVLTTLRQHRAFLEAVRDRLLVDPVVDRAELTEICGKHGLRVTAGE
jgi:cell division protease FtsH